MKFTRKIEINTREEQNNETICLCRSDGSSIANTATCLFLCYLFENKLTGGSEGH